jgi:hypothetical protein
MFEECLENITKNNLSKKSVMDHYQHLALLIDEMIDEGVVINTDGESLENKVFIREPKGASDSSSTTSSSGSYFSSVKIYIYFSFFQVPRVCFQKD